MKDPQTTVLQFVYEFFLAMEVNEINLAYEGVMSHNITKAFTYLTDSKLEAVEGHKHAQKKVFLVTVECLQNISRHACRNAGDKYGRGIFMVSRGDDKYRIIAGNTIENEKLVEFQYYLDYLNGLEKEKLDELYQMKLLNSSYTDKAGNGLGLLDIARTIKNKLIHRSLKLNDQFSFIAIIFTIDY